MQKNSINPRKDFPMLMRLRLGNDDSRMENFFRKESIFKAHDMDTMAMEVATALQRCAVPESSICPKHEGKFNEFLMYRIAETHEHLLMRGAVDRSCTINPTGAGDDECSLYKLFCTRIITPTNFQALLCMCDPAIRTGVVRCHAIKLLNAFEHFPYNYSMQIPAGDAENGTAPSSLAKKRIAVMAKALTQHGFCEHADGTSVCGCSSAAWKILGTDLSMTLEFEDPEGMLDFLSLIHWPRLLQQDDKFVHKTSDGEEGPTVYYDTTIFLCLHRWAVQVLVNDPSNTKAKTFLREQLGSCHELLQKSLHRIISCEIFSPPNDDISRQVSCSRLDGIRPTSFFLFRFWQCLVQVPIDDKTMSLVRRARDTVIESFESSTTTAVSPRKNNKKKKKNKKSTNQNATTRRNQMKLLDEELLPPINVWQAQYNLSEIARMKFFHELYIEDAGSSNLMATNNKSVAENLQKLSIKELKTSTTNREGEMCSNCFVLEKNLQGFLLQQCSCCQAKFCSRKCQVEHWDKAHHHYSKNKAKKTGASSSKKS